MPLHWILAALVSSFIVRNTVLKKRLRIISLLLFLFFCNEIIFNQLALAWQQQPVSITTSQKFSAGIVLGGYASFDRDYNGYFNDASDRFIQICKLYHQHAIGKIVVTGGNRHPGKLQEADYVQQQLITLGVSQADIIVEDKSLNTFENATFSKRLIDSAKLMPPYLLVTSALHLPRAIRVFDKAGLPVWPYPANFIAVKRKWSFADYFWPEMNTLNKWNALIKEVVGLWGYQLFSKA